MGSDSADAAASPAAAPDPPRPGAFRVVILSPNPGLVREVAGLMAEAQVDAAVSVVAAASIDAAGEILADAARPGAIGAVFVDLTAPGNGGLGGVVRLQALAPAVPIVPVLGGIDPSAGPRGAPAAARSNAWRLDREDVVRAIRGAALHQEQDRRLFRLATRDPLTGLANRYMLEQRLERALKRARRTGKGGALVFVDLDGFKQVNDAHGHAAGDRILAGIALRLAGIARATDTVARYGGDEFVIVLEGVGDPSGVQRVIGDVRRRLAEPFTVDGKTLPVSCSVGIAYFGAEEGGDVASLLGRADREMYREKAREERPPGPPPERPA